MGNDLFGGLGGLMKGLSGLMPQDDPNVKLMNAQGDLDGLKKQENELYVEIGKLAYQRDGAAAAEDDLRRLSDRRHPHAREVAERDASGHVVTAGRVVDPRGALGARVARPAPVDTTGSDRNPKVDSATPGQSGAHSSLTQWRGKAR